MEYVAGMKGTSDDYKRAREMFEKAIALDPMYADAYALMGTIYYVEWYR
jgi:Tfp pilus assembly protein PilF